MRPQQESIKFINTSHHHANVLTLCILLYFSHMHTFVRTCSYVANLWLAFLSQSVVCCLSHGLLPFPLSQFPNQRSSQFPNHVCPVSESALVSSFRIMLFQFPNHSFRISAHPSFRIMFVQFPNPRWSSFRIMFSQFPNHSFRISAHPSFRIMFVQFPNPRWSSFRIMFSQFPNHSFRISAHASFRITFFQFPNPRVTVDLGYCVGVRDQQFTHGYPDSDIAISSGAISNGQGLMKTHQGSPGDWRNV